VRKLSALILFASLCAAATAQQQQHGAATRPAASDAAARFKAQVEAISAGEDTGARRAALHNRITEIQHNYGAWLFKHGEREGANLVVSLPRAAGMTKTLLLGAHYDRVAQGRGAVDNASGCAAVLELLAAFKARPLKNYSVGAVFFDYEEAGLVGSKAFVASDGADGVRVVPDVFINFDVFGYGDTLYATARPEDGPLARALKGAAGETKLPLALGRAYPPSDHLSFMNTRAEVASISIVGGDEIKSLTQLLSGGGRPEQMPRALSIIHTAADTPDKIDAAAAARALSTIERAIRLLDAQQP
jgi:aminopeptidase S